MLVYNQMIERLSQLRPPFFFFIVALLIVCLFLHVDFLSYSSISKFPSKAYIEKKIKMYAGFFCLVVCIAHNSFTNFVVWINLLLLFYVFIHLAFISFLLFFFSYILYRSLNNSIGIDSQCFFFSFDLRTFNNWMVGVAVVVVVENFLFVLVASVGQANMTIACKCRLNERMA